MKKLVTSALALSLLFNGANALALEKTGSEGKVEQESSVTYTFDENSHGFNPGLADYLIFPDSGSTEHQQFVSDLPEHLIGEHEKGLFLSSNNLWHGQRNFLYTTKKIDTDLELKPNTTYNVKFDMDIATREKNEVGLVGSPAENVFIKAGVTTKEPKTERERWSDGWFEGTYYKINTDIGLFPDEPGQDTIILDNMKKPTITDDRYEFKNVNNEDTQFVVTTDQNANLWLTVGTHSSFAGITSYYLTKINVTVNEIASPSSY